MNIGAFRLVSLAVLFSTAATELDNTDDTGTSLLSVGVGFGLGVTEDVAAALEVSSVVGRGDGVM